MRKSNECGGKKPIPSCEKNRYTKGRQLNSGRGKVVRERGGHREFVAQKDVVKKVPIEKGQMVRGIFGGTPNPGARGGSGS